MDNLQKILRAVFPCLPIGTAERGIQLPADTDKYHFPSFPSEKGFAQSSIFGHKIPKHHSVSKKILAQSSIYGHKKFKISNDEAASSIVSALMNAEKAGPSLETTIKSIVEQAGGWSHYLAKKLLAAFEAILKALEPLNGAMQEAKDKAIEAFDATEGFAAEHPIATEVFCTVLALGILAELLPWAIEALGFWYGFGELGPIEGE